MRYFDKFKSSYLLFLFIAIFAIVLSLYPTLSLRGKGQQTPPSPPDPAHQIVQTIALAHPQVRTFRAGGRVELFGSQPLGAFVPQRWAVCRTAVCRQFTLYRFDDNTTLTVIVNVESQTVLDVLAQPGLQPGVHLQLAEKALEIALNHPDVIEALGFRPKKADMAPVSAGMPGTVCDQGHFCVGPTFNLGDRIVWAIIDLTDEQLVGVNETRVLADGRSQPTPSAGSCPAPGSVNRDGWTVNYETTASDGFHVFDVTYQGMAVLTSAKLAEWHVDYNGTYFISGFVDATGCGSSNFMIPAHGETELRDLTEQGQVVGFELVQDFRMAAWGQNCNYRYGQRMQFYEDGRFRLAAGAYGRGCGIHPVYRPVTRIDLAVNGDDGDTFAAWTGDEWQPVITETVIEERELLSVDRSPLDRFTANGLRLTAPIGWIMDQSGRGYYVEPGRGQFDDNGRGDDPFLYITRHHAAEGDADLPSFGSMCCNDDFQQGPHLFLNDEPVQDTNIVLWYVAQHQTDALIDDGNGRTCWTVSGEPNPETYPCWGGPLFVPFGLNGGGVQAGFEVSKEEVVFGETAAFTSTNTITGTIPVNNLWEFGDGTQAAGEQVTHQYTGNGTFTVTLTADAFAWGSSTASKPITATVKSQFMPFISK